MTQFNFAAALAPLAARAKEIKNPVFGFSFRWSQSTNPDFSEADAGIRAPHMFVTIGGLVEGVETEAAEAGSNGLPQVIEASLASHSEDALVLRSAPGDWAILVFVTGLN